MSRALYILSALIGALILGCVTHATITATGGYGAASAPIIAALACGLAVGAAVLGIAWAHERRVLAVLLIVALCAGEAYAILMTAERTLASREAQQAPLREAAELRSKAEEAVSRADRAVASIVSDTPRLARAIEASSAVDRAAVEKAAEPGCRTNCRALLEQQVEAAADELRAARQEIADARQTAELRLQAARDTLATMPIPRSASPLADRIGVEPWQVDLLAAALASIAANGLAAILIAFAAHRAVPSASPVGSIELVRDADKEADLFARAALRPDPEGRVRVGDLRAAYHGWCADVGRPPLGDAQIGTALMRLFVSVGLRRVREGQEPAIAGIAWTRRFPEQIAAPAICVAADNGPRRRAMATRNASAT